MNMESSREPRMVSCDIKCSGRKRIIQQYWEVWTSEFKGTNEPKKEGVPEIKPRSIIKEEGVITVSDAKVRWRLRWGLALAMPLMATTICFIWVLEAKTPEESLRANGRKGVRDSHYRQLSYFDAKNREIRGWLMREVGWDLFLRWGSTHLFVDGNDS